MAGRIRWEIERDGWGKMTERKRWSEEDGGR